MKSSNAEAVELDELFDCPILSSLKGTQTYQLLEIFAKGNCQQFKEFADKNSSFLSESGRKMFFSLLMLRNRPSDLNPFYRPSRFGSYLCVKAGGNLC